ncbi:adenylate/guanylate cyclase domain-containing protein [Tumebacillus lipolyticus]|uniref:Adenylate/guanylate cyclase domain-containing protein n=1 Tax=Tumebacillus lipolyticus TaxID=1280370 RepID=A0ABW5A025_9BACL
MRRNLIRLLILLLLISTIGFVTYQNSLYLAKPSFDSLVPIKNAYRITSDANDNFYIISEAKQSIVKLGLDGTLKYKIEAPPVSEFASLNTKEVAMTDENLSFVTFDQVLPAEDGGLYAVVRVMDINALTLKHEAIVRYDADGELDSDWVGFSRPYSVTERSSLRGGTILALQYKAGKLFLITQESEAELDLNEWDPEFNRFSKVTSAHLPLDTTVSDIVGVKSKELIYTTKKGEIYRASERLYPQNRTGQIGTYAEDVKLLGTDVYFLDQYGESVKRFSLLDPAKVETVFTQKEVASALAQQLNDEEERPEFPIKSLGVTESGNLLVTIDQHAVLYTPTKEFVPLSYSSSTKFRQYLVWIGAAVAALLLLFILKILYVDIMPRSLIYKQLFIMIPLISLSMLLLSYLVQKDFRADIEDEVRRSLIYVAHDGQNLVDPEQLIRINSPQDYMSEAYQAIKAKLNFRDHYGKFYMMVYKYKDGRLYEVVEDDNDLRMFDSFEVAVDDTAISACMVSDPSTGQLRKIGADFDYNRALEHQEYLTCQSEDENGTWLFALGPLFNADKSKVIGVYEAGFNMHGFELRMDSYWYGTLQKLTVFAVLILLVVLTVTIILLTSIRNLSNSANQIAKGRWGTRVAVNSQDEVAALGHSFNDMSTQVERKVIELREFRDGYRHFVPEKFLDYLGKPDIRHVELGDQVELEMSILVVNIRDFHQFMEDMKDKTEDNFNFINRFLHVISPVVDHNNGNVSKYMDHGILAVFPDSPSEAVQAAVEMKRSIESYNVRRIERGKARIEVGIGIQHGPLMLGIIGAEERLEVSVISDSVQVTMVFEEISDKLGATILLPARVWVMIEDRDKYRARSLGLLLIKEKMTEPIELYDIFEADGEEQCRLKQKTKELFESAIIKYQQGRFYDAREAFLEVIRQNPADKIAQLYFYVCDENFRTGLEYDWKGTLEV